ncbi:MAG: hypothetical protein ACI3XA_03335 [Clostridia bacterium]
MKRFIALFLVFVLIFSFSACGKNKNPSISASSPEEFLTEFFSSYDNMRKYLNNSEIAISAFALDGVGLKAVLRAVYEAMSVTYAFSEPKKVSDEVYTASVIVTAPDIQPLYDMYYIDKTLSENEKINEDFVAQSFYSNIMSGTTSLVTTTVTVIIRHKDGKWTLDPSNDLAFAIFPNIDKSL